MQYWKALCRRLVVSLALPAHVGCTGGAPSSDEGIAGFEVVDGPKRLERGTPKGLGLAPCGTADRETIAGEGSVAGTESCYAGVCDDPDVRDSFIPDSSTPVRTVRLRFHIFLPGGGWENQCPVWTDADVAAVLAQLNRDFAPSQVRFIETHRFISDSDFHDSPNVRAMKNLYAEDPHHQVNVFIPCRTVAWAGLGTFPWETQALDTDGGIVLTSLVRSPSWKGDMSHALTHELGHNLGLYHTFEGTSQDVEECLRCTEFADGSNGNAAGDLCADTAPTPKNLTCDDPGGRDCRQDGYGRTDTQNFMSYAPDDCQSEFSPQQQGRMHCWIEDRLTGWLPIPSWDIQLSGTVGGARPAFDERTGDIVWSGRANSGTVDLDPRPSSQSLVSPWKAFVARVGRGGEFRWAQAQDPVVTDLAMGEDGSVVVVGRFSGTATFPGGVTLTSAGGEDGYVAKYGSDGAFDWATRFGGTSYDRANAVAIGRSAVFVTGARGFEGQMSSNQIYVGAFDLGGREMRSLTWGSSRGAEGIATAVGEDASLIIGASFGGDIDLSLFEWDSAPSFAAPNGASLLFGVNIYAGTNWYVRWARTVGSSGATSLASIATDSNGELFLAGRTAPGESFDGYSVGDSGARAYIAHAAAPLLGPSGWVPPSIEWVHPIISSSTTNNGNAIRVGQLTLDEDRGRIALTGGYTWQVNFGGGYLPRAGEGNGSARDRDVDMFVAELDTSGNHLWSRGFGRSADNEGRGVAYDSTFNRLVVTASSSGPIDFGQGLRNSGAALASFAR